ncbi:translation initiation factor 2 [Intestinimonas massiliensis (ex Afouda et al. 2020)]|uniref:translation initiation factor 2 n=1 Tax=Intestinimonas massiliensis (ex Afouda et al. 2020) TaxID=1673721 RepID=UPI0010315255|nr:translation initiation factor 2 [Intestinimonas massiliensis (ex Afouda et al. 2020)]
MPATKNLCALIDLNLHTKVCEEREKAGQTTSQYITQLLIEYYEMKENGGKRDMTNNGNRTMAFQIPEELFQRIKHHLDRESERQGRKVTQREFVLGLIEEALSKAEAASEEVNTEAGDNMEGEAEPEPDQVESGGDEEADQTA